MITGRQFLFLPLVLTNSFSSFCPFFSGLWLTFPSGISLLILLAILLASKTCIDGTSLFAHLQSRSQNRPAKAQISVSLACTIFLQCREWDHWLRTRNPLQFLFTFKGQIPPLAELSRHFGLFLCWSPFLQTVFGLSPTVRILVAVSNLTAWFHSQARE